MRLRLEEQPPISMVAEQELLIWKKKNCRENRVEKRNYDIPLTYDTHTRRQGTDISKIYKIKKRKKKNIYNESNSERKRWKNWLAPDLIIFLSCIIVSVHTLHMLNRNLLLLAPTSSHPIRTSIVLSER